MMDKLPWVLKRYNNSDYSIRQRAKFIFYLCSALIITILLLIAFQLYSHPLTNPNDPAHFSTLLPILMLFLLVVLCLGLLLLGRYILSANLIPVSVMLTIWLIMFTEKSSQLTKFNTIVYIFVAFAMLPLLMQRRKYIIIIYSMVNVVILFVFISIFRSDYALSRSETLDYIIDNSISFLFLGLVCYNIYNINKKALDRAESHIKKQEEAEEALALSEKKYREMTNLLPQIVFESDTYGILTYVNKTGFNLFGYSEEEFSRGINILTVIKEREKAIQNIQNRLACNDRKGNQYTAISKDGREFPIEIFSNPIVENGKAIGMRGIIIDISERVRAEENLRQNRELFKTLVESNPNAILLIDFDGNILMANKAFVKDIAETTIDETIGKKVADLGISLGKNTSDEINKILVQKGHIENYETTYTDKHGKTQNILLWISIVKVNNKKVILASTINITDRKQLENKLRESETLFRLMVDMVPYSILITDIQARYTFVNRAYLEKYNIESKDIVGKTALEAGFILDEESIRKLQQANAKDGRLMNMEISLKSPDNKEVFSLLSSQPVEIDGQPHRIITAVDITERKYLENKLIEYAQQLETLVKERTNELNRALFELQNTNSELQTSNHELKLQREQLEQALKQLSEAQEHLIQTEKMAALGILTSGFAHEINNPINFIYNGAIAVEHYINDHCSNHSNRLNPLINAIKTGINRTTNLVKSLNKYTQSDDIQFSKCNVHEIIDNCLTILVIETGTRIAIERKYKLKEPFMMGKEGSLHQAFLNILTNAIQSIEKNGKITIHTTLIDNKLEIRFKDSGKGIREENIKYIFDPFFTTKDPGEGTGLGLSVTQRIIKEHNGTINCKSEIGIGTEFIINLPANY